MIPARIPTQAENAWAVNDARRYAAVQASRFDHRNRTPVFTCTAPARRVENDAPSRGLTWLTLIVATVVGLGIWAAVMYATWWTVGLFFAQGVK